MADLPEVNEWPEGIYQLETSDPVLGGPEGIDNLQAKQLANRTKWLKDQIAKIVEGATSIGKAVRLETARALKFKGAATGTGSFDGSADIEITLALANSGVTEGTWPKVAVNAKGLVTGGSNLDAADLPAGITAPQFDNDKSLATTEFVQRALGSFAGYATYAANTVLTASDVGKYVYANATTITLTLPDATLLPGGSRIYIQAAAMTTCTVRSINGNISGPNGNQVGSPNVVLGNGVSTEFVASGMGWLAVGGSGLALLSATGYQRLSSGLIDQWGSVAVTDNAEVNVILPIAFPNAIFGAVVSVPLSAQAGAAEFSIAGVRKNGSSLNSILVNANSGPTMSVNPVVSWRVWGA